jgi:hypothetical protein
MTGGESVADKIAAAFAGHDGQNSRFLGLYNTPAVRRAGRKPEFSLELRDALTGERTALGTYPWSECQTIITTALAAIAAERASLVTRTRERRRKAPEGEQYSGAKRRAATA